ncbi:MAG TPA: NADH-quinone oxidoreductase subunit J [Oculatellaceae cyanobacterium]|jgi:NADH:ubiquinone oxidoreductase subunit 6 (subunit J)
MVDSVIFWAFALVSVGAALGAILSRSIIYAALCLIAVFFSIAGFFLLNNADFLAISQIIIYAVGLTIIMLFAIMFTGDKPFAPNKAAHPMRMMNRLIAVYVVALLLWACSRVALPKSSSFSIAAAEVLARSGSTGLLGKLLYSQYAIPFELASILLLAAMIGAIVIAKKRFTESEDLGEVRLPVDTASAPPEQAIAALRAARLGEPQEQNQDSNTDQTAGVR